MSLSKHYRDIIAHVERNVIGQAGAVRQLSRALKIAQSGLRDAERPLAILMFAGPTGTGKSEIARALTEAIHGDPTKLCRVDCNLLTESHTAAALAGSPPGYVGSVEGHTLLDKRMIEGTEGKPGVLVFEELEKAHPAVFDTMLGIFDKGVLHMNNGKGKIDFSNTIIIMTSNAGARALSQAASNRPTGFGRAVVDAPPLTDKEREDLVASELRLLFRPEFLNRLDDVVVFDWLGSEELMSILEKFLGALACKLEKFPHFLHISWQAKEFLLANGTDIANGARPLRRSIARHLEDPLAEFLVDGLPFKNVRFFVNHRLGSDRLTIDFEGVYVPEPIITQPMIEAAEPAAEEVEAAVSEGMPPAEDGDPGD